EQALAGSADLEELEDEVLLGKGLILVEAVLLGDLVQFGDFHALELRDAEHLRQRLAVGLAGDALQFGGLALQLLIGGQHMVGDPRRAAATAAAAATALALLALAPAGGGVALPRLLALLRVLLGPLLTVRAAL